jgi:UDP-2,4-diacetamido-2,4,6-trideoxy-beta-L-altropyranose hydrolase
MALANLLRSRGTTVCFITRELEGNIASIVEGRGFDVARLVQSSHELITGACDAEETRLVLEQKQWDPDWIVVDNYGLDINWETAIRPSCDRLLVVDDLADRKHDCDVLLDQNLHPVLDNRYSGLVPAECVQLLGPRWVILREEFMLAVPTRKVRSAPVERVLVFFGGSDPTNETAKTLSAISQLPRRSFQVDVVVGATNPHREQIRHLCQDLRDCNFHIQIDNMAELVSRADLALGAGGSASWERAILGLPTITIITAENQRAITQAIAMKGAIRNLGWHAEATPSIIAAALEENDGPILSSQSISAMEVMKGCSGGAEITTKICSGVDPREWDVTATEEAVQ